ncbi:MAG: hypothetical protein HY747_09490 [Elusimicrobia bacterium]|nr:hypothetical protein [Elusimicrobiota bacterium]
MKNIYGIGYGILDGLGASANTKSFYLIRAIEEMTSAAVHVGGSKKTVHGPAGLGDLLTTGLSANSRNSRLGRLLSQGKSLKECRREIGMVTEGVDACMEFERLADKLGLKLKLARCIKNTLTSPTQAGKLLLCLK